MKAAGRRHVPALEWLQDLSGNTARITTMGNRSLMVENHCGILEFSCNRIVLAAKKGCIQINGASLNLSEVRRDALIIRGEIQSILLPCGEALSDEA